jgi:hypothetical protein
MNDKNEKRRQKVTDTIKHYHEVKKKRDELQKALNDAQIETSRAYEAWKNAVYEIDEDSQ